MSIIKIIIFLEFFLKKIEEKVCYMIRTLKSRKSNLQ